MRCEKIGGVEAARRRVEIKCEKIRGIARTKGKSGSCRRIYVVPVIAFSIGGPVAPVAYLLCGSPERLIVLLVTSLSGGVLEG